MPVITAFLNAFVEPAAPSRRAPRPRLLARAGAILRDAQLRSTERQIGRLIEANGGRLTDEVERAIGRHFA